MKQNNVLVAAIVCASVAIVGLSGCGGSSNSGGGGGGGTPPTITSFTGSPAIIEAGSSASLTAVFSGGTGVITPGNIAASSGTAVSVSPATTTMYTLTVTSSGGLVSSQTSTVTVDPLPTITSFSAGAATIEAGSSTSLTAVFSGGTGTITAPGGYSSPVTSGIAVSISPTTTTPYTLTVTPPVGTVNATMMTTVTVDPVPTITSFSANPNPITTSGGSSALTAVFAGGTGTITAPGGYSSPVTSGVAVNVSPTATTTYTLTVTPPVGTVNATQAVTVTVAPPPVITSFTVAPTAIEDGSSAQLTAVFSGGTGVVTPGNITMTSGTPVSVLPTSTTTYTLTVTPPAGQAIKQTTTLTVSPAPAITSFTANPTTIAAGSSSTLTPVFSGGTGVITPGNITATSGTGVSVSPTTTTTYTLTVTPALGNAITAMATVTLSGTSVTVNQTPTTVAVQRRIELRFRYIDADKKVISHRFLPAPSPSLRDTGLLTRATVRAVRLVSGRDDQALPTVLKTLGRDGLVTPGLTQIVGNLKIQGQGGSALPPLRPLEEFHSDPRYGGDLHRADLAWARHAAAMGLAAARFARRFWKRATSPRRAVLERQHEYAERTAGKALRQTK